MTTKEGSPSSLSTGFFKTSFFSNVSSSVNALSQTIQTKGLPEINKRFNELQERARNLPNQLASLQGDLETERTSFLENKKLDTTVPHQAKGSEPVTPWMGYQGYENEMKKAIMDISKDERNFLIPPPEDTNFQFDLNAYSASAQAALREDKALSQSRFLLVPQQVSEPTFWRNYFYRVTLAKQAVLSQPPTQQEQGVLFDFKDEESLEEEPVIVEKEASVEKEAPVRKEEPVKKEPVKKESVKKEEVNYEGMEDWEIELRKAAI
ncbi:uncharacterized protein B0P05DRAFT_637067 [Gilbertella persicaria]|uniref:uncharacterized protein n=1 Tax=Gilbertella persicaria TaxID=101096 RepID=UPI00221E3B41|nr:uncharacterized protein B0P05DRAFT_637067 [Gilbertella persicaria]KAI8080859.1 hypothetical protein B0P05DRAFT_637067 [Gilbertella persicaria]